MSYRRLLAGTCQVLFQEKSKRNSLDCSRNQGLFGEESKLHASSPKKREQLEISGEAAELFQQALR